jgi:membrane protease YdiL (CAAX protease family)
MFIVIFALIGVATVGLCRLLRLNPVHPKIARPKRSALCSLASLLASMLMIAALQLLQRHKLLPPPDLGPKLSQLQDLAHQLVILVMYFVPMVITLRLNGETLQSAGFTTANLWRATIVGLLLAAMLLSVGKGPGAFLRSLSGHRPIFCGLVGFGEEFLFRGYVQTRMVAWLGYNRGWILASIVFALAHLPARVIIEGLGSPNALASLLGVIPGSLLMGFIMLRTGSVISSGVFHTIGDLMSS